MLYRVASWFKHHRIPILGPFFSRLGLFLTGVDISPGAQIAPGLLLSHGTGLVIGESARIGEDATILHQVTIGAPDTGRLDEMPDIGRDVYIGAGAVLIGGIKLGDNVIIGTNTVITSDVPDNHRVVSAAPTKISERRSDYQPIQRSAAPSAPQPDQ